MKEIKNYFNDGQIGQHYWIDEKRKYQGEFKDWYEDGLLYEHVFYHNDEEINITEYVADKNNITEEEYFHLQQVFGYFPIIKFDGTNKINKNQI